MYLSAAQNKFLIEAALSAVRVERATLVPAELSLTQSALESGWGQNAPPGNCFGIKAPTAASGPRGLFVTTERFTIQGLHYFLGLGEGRTATLIPNHTIGNTELFSVRDYFRIFPNFDACFDDHAQLISTDQRYASAWKIYMEDRAYKPADTVLRKLIRDIGPIYATADGYAEYIWGFCQSATIRDAIAHARAVTPPVSVPPVS